MRKKETDFVHNSVKRLVLVVLAVLLQIAWMVFLLTMFNKYFSTLCNVLFGIVGTVLVLRIYTGDENSASKILWIIVILSLPVLGLCLYMLFGHRYANKNMRLRSERVNAKLSEEITFDRDVMEQLEETDIGFANQCRYLENYGKYPLYRNTDVEFYADTKDGLLAQLEELKKAEHFIFMEYHAIEEREAFGQIREVLAERAANGVEVRLLYDDVGSVGFINTDFVKRMEALGICCRVFNEVMPVLKLFMNNRDHRKITVVDGRVGFTGGYNLADEYFNITHPYGQWKDTGVKLTGDAVKSLTAMFLEMWNIEKESDHGFSQYFQKFDYRAKETGFVQPYADTPLGAECIGENVYMNLIKQAKRRVYITTPYLGLSDEMRRELCMAAQRGVDVRIVTPGIPDKKMIFRLTRSYYAGLVKRGVRIYEYSPGFMHAKQVLCDGDMAVVGTINFDYRSFYHHFENAVLLCGCKAIEQIGNDFQDIFAVSGEVTESYRQKASRPLRLGQCVLRLLAPLL